MRRGTFRPVIAGVTVAVLMAGVAGCGTTDQLGSTLDDFLGTTAPPPESAGTRDDAASLPRGDAAPTQPAPAPTVAQPVAPQPQPQPAPQMAEGQPTPGGPQLLAGQRAQSQSTAAAPTSLSPQPQSQPQQVARAQTPQPAPQPAPSTGQGSLSDAARTTSTDDGRKVVPGPDSSVGSELERRIDSLFGSSAAAPTAEPTVEEAKIVGNWVLNEEDGLRTCAMTFAGRDGGSRVTAAQDCSGLAATITSWGLFGSDLLLNDAGKTVVARLRPSGDRWFGFTLGTGIPIVLARGS